MALPNDPLLQELRFYVTTPYTCGYLPQRRAQSLIATPPQLVTPQVYTELIRQGFRRSGNFAYRPHCEHCQACISVRLVLDRFQPNRSQRRAFRQHADLQAHILPVGFHDAHFALYQHYQAARHAEADFGNNQSATGDAGQYREFLCQSNVDSVMVEFKDAHGALKMVSVVDVVEDGLSAVYTFYDTRDPKTSLGTYNILWLAEKAKSLGLPYLYLGYWIETSRKMTYKQAFQPQERLIDGVWVDAAQL